MICQQSAWYEALSVLHMMATFRLSQADSLLLAKTSLEGYYAKVSEENNRASVEINLKAAGHLQYAMHHDLPRMSPEKRWSYCLPCQLGMVNNVPNILGRNLSIFSLHGPCLLLFLRTRGVYPEKPKWYWDLRHSSWRSRQRGRQGDEKSGSYLLRLEFYKMEWISWAGSGSSAGYAKQRLD